jgi:hypothetical protein
MCQKLAREVNGGAHAGEPRARGLSVKLTATTYALKIISCNETSVRNSLTVSRTRDNREGWGHVREAPRGR